MKIARNKLCPCDSGKSWTALINLMSVNRINAFLKIGNNIFAGTSGGIFLSNDNGKSWILKNDGLTNTNILSLLVNGNNIYAGTKGGGVFKANIEDLVTDINEFENIFFQTTSNISPNPVKELLRLKIFTNEPETISIRIFDCLGNIVLNLDEKKIISNVSEISLNVSKLPAGVYILKLDSKKGVETHKFIKGGN